MSDEERQAKELSLSEVSARQNEVHKRMKREIEAAREAAADGEWTDETRQACYRLLRELPDEAISEALETLVGIHEFYTLPLTPKQTPLPLASYQIRARPRDVRQGPLPVVNEDEE